MLVKNLYIRAAFLFIYSCNLWSAPKLPQRYLIWTLSDDVESTIQDTQVKFARQLLLLSPFRYKVETSNDWGTVMKPIPASIEETIIKMLNELQNTLDGGEFTLVIFSHGHSEGFKRKYSLLELKYQTVVELFNKILGENNINFPKVKINLNIESCHSGGFIFKFIDYAKFNAEILTSTDIESYAYGEFTFKLNHVLRLSYLADSNINVSFYEYALYYLNRFNYQGQKGWLGSGTLQIPQAYSNINYFPSENFPKLSPTLFRFFSIFGLENYSAIILAEELRKSITNGTYQEFFTFIKEHKKEIGDSNYDFFSREGTGWRAQPSSSGYLNLLLEMNDVDFFSFLELADKSNPRGNTIIGFSSTVLADDEDLMRQLNQKVFQIYQNNLDQILEVQNDDGAINNRAIEKIDWIIRYGLHHNIPLQEIRNFAEKLLLNQNFLTIFDASLKGTYQQGEKILKLMMMIFGVFDTTDSLQDSSIVNFISGKKIAVNFFMNSYKGFYGNPSIFFFVVDKYFKTELSAILPDLFDVLRPNNSDREVISPNVLLKLMPTNYAYSSYVQMMRLIYFFDKDIYVYAGRNEFNRVMQKAYLQQSLNVANFSLQMKEQISNYSQYSNGVGKEIDTLLYPNSLERSAINCKRKLVNYFDNLRYLYIGLKGKN